MATNFISETIAQFAAKSRLVNRWKRSSGEKRRRPRGAGCSRLIRACLREQRVSLIRVRCVRGNPPRERPSLSSKGGTIYMPKLLGINIFQRRRRICARGFLRQSSRIPATSRRACRSGSRSRSPRPNPDFLRFQRGWRYPRSYSNSSRAHRGCRNTACWAWAGHPRAEGGE